MAFMLTTGVDTIVGTAGNDTINSSMTDGGTPSPTLGGLDSVDGGAGTDTLNVDFGSTVASLSTATIKNIEVLNVATSNTAAVANGVDLDVSNIVGLKTVAVVNGGTKASIVKGAEVVSVTGGTAATVSGKALTSVTVIKAGGAVDVSNDTAAVAGEGTTLTAVTLQNLAVGAATAALKGNAITEVTLKSQAVAMAATITNTASTALKVNVDGAGYDAAGAVVGGVSVAAGAKAEAITVNATGAKSVNQRPILS
ncbi:MAG: hypothetical protein U0989_05120, partial [Azonexus sp.]|nr:hypothetical protein [Azonexus sp.]